jgi:RNA-directed DNA polymerase
MTPLLEILTAGTGLSEHDVMKIVWNAPVRYKFYAIEKRNGGTRHISQPAREVKALQRLLTTEILSTLPVHRCATAYRPGKSIKDNAAAHAGNGPIMKYDFKDFFPSIVAKDWRSYCQTNNVFSDTKDIWVSTNLLFHRRPGSSRLNLAIGAPSSPCLSNILMNEFDIKLSNSVTKEQVTYTRYADDLTFSARRTGFLTRVDRMLREAIRETSNPTLTLNDAKTVVATRKYKRFVTGLVLTNDNKVSLGHERKRTIRAALHHYVTGKLDIDEQAKLAGMIAFASDIEPDFVSRLQAKYGFSAFQQLKAVRLPARPFGR